MDSRVLPGLIVIAFLLLLLALMVVGFRRRQRRQSGLPHPESVPDEIGRERYAVDAFYVASTVADQPLERIAVGGLGFRGRANIVVFERGIVLGIAGEQDAFLPVDDIAGVDRSTATIDRVVERGGLIRICWRLGEHAIDSYLRVTNPAGQAELISAIESLLDAPAESTRAGEDG